MYDVIIVGARVAGASTAMLLARRGLKVLVVDRATFPSDTLSTHQVQLPGVARLARWGLLDAVLAAGAPLTRDVRFDQGDAVITGRYPAYQGVEAMCSPRRTLLDRVLVDAVDGVLHLLGPRAGPGRQPGRDRRDIRQARLRRRRLADQRRSANDLPGLAGGPVRRIPPRRRGQLPAYPRHRGPGRADPGRAPGGAFPRHPRPAQLPAPALRSRLGPGWRRRLADGPGHRPGHQPRLPRRGTAG